MGAGTLFQKTCSRDRAETRDHHPLFQKQSRFQERDHPWGKDVLGWVHCVLQNFPMVFSHGRFPMGNPRRNWTPCVHGRTSHGIFPMDSHGVLPMPSMVFSPYTHGFLPMHPMVFSPYTHGVLPMHPMVFSPYTHGVLPMLPMVFSTLYPWGFTHAPHGVFYHIPMGFYPCTPWGFSTLYPWGFTHAPHGFFPPIPMEFYPCSPGIMVFF